MLKIFTKKYSFNFIIDSNKNHLENAEKIQLLGDGGSANVYLYKCKNDYPFTCNKLFVIKTIQNNESTKGTNESFDKKAKISIKKEFIINKILNHQNIINIIGIDISNKSILYRFEKSNDLLYYFIKDEDNFNPKNYFRYYIQTIDAIKYMHSLGIAHMDIKLENILLNPVEKNIKIIDFGHSCFFKKGNKVIYNKGLKGTEYYMPPEVWKISYMSDKVDVWCCGILLYNFIYNNVPWNRATEDDEIYLKFRKYRLQNMLLSNIFKHPSLYGFNSEDSNNIMEVFLMTLNLNYYTRSKITDIYNKLLKITLE